nr:hypothetical protein OHB51_20395 [Micromonospora sp. NBC_00855]
MSTTTAPNEHPGQRADRVTSVAAAQPIPALAALIRTATCLQLAARLADRHPDERL